MPDRNTGTSFQHLYEMVFADLVGGRYRPGDRIGIRDLATRFRVSPTPIREILSRLIGRHIVEERRSEGYYLARLTVRDLIDLYRLHGVCIDLFFAHDLVLPTPGPDQGYPDAWALLSAMSATDANIVRRNVQVYLDDRLRLVRRCEIHQCDEAAIIQAQGQQGDRKALRRSVAHFYRRKMVSAPSLMMLLEQDR